MTTEQQRLVDTLQNKGFTISVFENGETFSLRSNRFGDCVISDLNKITAIDYVYQDGDEPTSVYIRFGNNTIYCSFISKDFAVIIS